MDNKRITIELLKRPVAYHAILAKTFKSVKLALMLSQLYYWSDKTKDPDGWIYKTQAEMYGETGLTRKEQETARDHGRRLEVIDEKLCGSPPKLHYRVNLERTTELINEHLLKEDGRQTSLFPKERVATPGEMAREFFTQGSSIRSQIKEEILKATNAPEEAVVKELQKFVLYWTEPNKSGTKVRWEMQRTFDVKRRIYTWLSRAQVDGEQRAGGGVSV